MALMLVACGGTTNDVRAPRPLPDVSVESLATDVWLHTSYRDVPGFGVVLSHGLVVRADGNVILVDTAWDDAQTAEVNAWVGEALGREVTSAVVTHAHADKMGGMKMLHEAGVATYAIAATNEDAAARDLLPAMHTLALEDGGASIANGALEVFYPGAGHTRDNIVVYHPASKVLFGGCLIRPGESDTMGNTNDGDVDHWDDAVVAVKMRFPEAQIVVPSHGAPGGVALLDHTIALAQKHR